MLNSRTLTSNSISFFSVQEAITDITKLLYKEKIVEKIKVSRRFYNQIQTRYEVIKFENGPERFYGVPLEVDDTQEEPYVVYYKDEEVRNAN